VLLRPPGWGYVEEAETVWDYPGYHAIHYDRGEIIR
jgi:hypothetical protein